MSEEIRFGPSVPNVDLGRIRQIAQTLLTDMKGQRTMHYRNGREAKNGDKIVVVGNTFGCQTIGILHSAVAGNDYCNGFVAPIAGPMSVNLKDCLHLDDVLAAVAKDPALAEPKPAEPVVEAKT